MKKSGAWFSYDGNRIGQGRDNAKEYLRTNPEVAEKVEAELMSNKEKLTFTRGSAKKTAKKPADEAPAEAERPETKPAAAPAAEAAAPAPESRTSGEDIDILVE